MRKLMISMTLLVTVLVPTNVASQQNQFSYSSIGSTISRASALSEEGDRESAAVLYEQIIAMYKVEEGLYTTTAIDLMFQLRDWAEERRDFEEAIKWSYMAHFAITRNKHSDKETYQRLIASNLYTTPTTRCLKRSDTKNLRFQVGGEECSKERYYYADSVIRAVDLQRYIIENLDSSKEELLYLYSLAELATGAVYGVDGDEIIIIWPHSDDEIPYEIDNPGIRERYSWRRYLRIQKDVADTLIRLENKDGI